jgi:hypothetical protein
VFKCSRMHGTFSDSRINLKLLASYNNPACRVTLPHKG